MRFLTIFLVAVLGLAASNAAAATAGLARFASHDPTSSRTVDHRAFAAFLDRYRVVGDDGIARLGYAAVTAADAARLDGYLDDLAEVEVTALNRDEQLAFWLNLFNATVVDLVHAHYPVASIRDIDLDPRAAVAGPWTAATRNVAGVELSLVDIEDRILFRHWDDPRLHYALHRGSLGCPNLPHEPFVGARLDRQLDRAAITYVNHPRGVTFENGELIVSSLYRWYQDDFGGSQRDVLRHLMAFAEPTRAMRLQKFDGIDDDRYDWRLNDR